MKMHVGGQWIGKEDVIEVLNPFDGAVVDTVPRAGTDDVTEAIDTAVRGAEVMRRMPAFERYELLHKAADLMTERLDDLGRTITLEEGKILPEGMGEAARAQETITLSAEEAKRLTGRDPRPERRIQRRRQVRLHPAGALRRGGGDHALQLSL